MTIRNFFFTVVSLTALITLSACAGMQTSSNSADAGGTSAIARNEPYFPTSFNDFEVPGELQSERKKSMYINTNSFTGGILNFSGRVEVNSLTDFFINSMQKNGWKLTGEARYENVMLAFTKPNKSCMLTIYEGEYGAKTQVYVYITKDLLTGASEQTLR